MTLKKIVLATLLSVVLGSLGTLMTYADQVDEVVTHAEIEFLNDAPPLQPPLPPTIAVPDKQDDKEQKDPSGKIFKKPTKDKTTPKKAIELSKKGDSLKKPEKTKKLDNEGKTSKNFPQTGELKNNKILIFGLIILVMVGLLYKKNKQKEND
ncbi:LPXTG cell wall anchor domain-containing protein [Vagococcus intermedius]|uniref:LPXTG cell wall anchor domain-containing protein n=1 Tax=Vagococcus intermedius TaxID=2991418 RepID=A0AAF0CUF9_9ENTE|nr:LPXTG cell wall anchor domain-containing protein [Vagococcus intermedius]WEG73101.1 LPXTG cell wall anchor domain-containing protein [Vagococcus intermedius]WEG75185.1 LPXTG cell wall anchor domain-containing protein [Vagococcus intermedius]